MSACPDSTRAALHGRLGESDLPPPRWYFGPPEEGEEWLIEMSSRLRRILPKWSPYYQDAGLRRDLLKSVHYEATRAGVDPQLVLAIIHAESAFRKLRDFHRGRARADAGDAVLDGFNRGQKPQPCLICGRTCATGQRFCATTCGTGKAGTYFAPWDATTAPPARRAIRALLTRN